MVNRMVMAEGVPGFASREGNPGSQMQTAASTARREPRRLEHGHVDMLPCNSLLRLRVSGGDTVVGVLYQVTVNHPRLGSESLLLNVMSAVRMLNQATANYRRLPAVWKLACQHASEDISCTRRVPLGSTGYDSVLVVQYSSYHRLQFTS